MVVTVCAARLPIVSGAPDLMNGLPVWLCIPEWALGNIPIDIVNAYWVMKFYTKDTVCQLH